MSVTIKDIITAESVLADLTAEMAVEFENGGKDWPRDWMQKHANDRMALLKARNVLIERGEKLNRNSGN
jgi:hypothetical protein